MLEDLTIDTFSGRVGETFRLDYGAEEPLKIVLIEARGHRGDGEKRQPFSIVFRAPRGPVLNQMIRRLEHPELGALELFLVPIGPDEEGLRYEAVFT